MCIKSLLFLPMLKFLQSTVHTGVSRDITVVMSIGFQNLLDRLVPLQNFCFHKQGVMGRYERDKRVLLSARLKERALVLDHCHCWMAGSNLAATAVSVGRSGTESE